MNEEYDFVVSQPRNNFETGTKQRGVQFSSFIVSDSKADGWIFMLIAHCNAPFVLVVAVGVIDNLTATEIYSL